MTDREFKLEIVAKKLVKYFGAVDPKDYAEAISEDGSTLELCVSLAKAALRAAPGVRPDPKEQGK